MVKARGSGLAPRVRWDGRCWQHWRRPALGTDAAFRRRQPGTGPVFFLRQRCKAFHDAPPGRMPSGGAGRGTGSGGVVAVMARRDACPGGRDDGARRDSGMRSNRTESVLGEGQEERWRPNGIAASPREALRTRAARRKRHTTGSLSSAANLCEPQWRGLPRLTGRPRVVVAFFSFELHALRGQGFFY